MSLKILAARSIQSSRTKSAKVRLNVNVIFQETVVIWTLNSGKKLTILACAQHSSKFPVNIFIIIPSITKLI